MKQTMLVVPVVMFAMLAVSFQASAGETFGPAFGASVYVDATRFHPVQGPIGTYCGLELVAEGGYYSNECNDGTSSAVYHASFELPEGALIDEVFLNYYDNDVSGAFVHEVLKLNAQCCGGGTPTTVYGLAGMSFSSGNDAGYQSWLHQPSPRPVYDTYNHTNNVHSIYALRIQMPTSTNVRYRGTWIFYTRQVAPAPAFATFSDVPASHPFFNEVEQLAKSGITLGCGNGNYCPDATVTRGQMAVFLSRALGLHWGTGTNAP